jgi:hypothetical protein
LWVYFFVERTIPNRFAANRQQMGVNISQIFRGSIILEKSPSSDIHSVCLTFGDESKGCTNISWPFFSFLLVHVSSARYWIVLLLGFLFYLSGVIFSTTLIAQDTENGSIEFFFGQSYGEQFSLHGSPPYCCLNKSTASYSYQTEEK